MERALALARAHPHRLLVTTYPIPVHARYSNLPEITTRVNALLRQETKRLQIPLLDTVACIQREERRSPAPFCNNDGIHLFAQGYGAMARCIAVLLEPYLDGRG